MLTLLMGHITTVINDTIHSVTHQNIVHSLKKE